MSTAELEAEVVAAPPDIQLGDIDGAFVPRPAEGVTTYAFGSETILTGGSTVRTQHLDQIASLVWGLFDGTATLDELADDLAAGFQHDRGVIYDDLLALTHKLGGAGLLAGVALPTSAPRPVGIDAGEPFADFRYLDEHGVEMTGADLLGRRTAMVNWRATCGYCAKIAPEIGELAPALADAGVDLVFIVPDDAAGNRELLATHGVPGRLLVKGSDIDGDDPFPGMGTPYAYLIDEAGLVAEPLASGADQVPGLLRRAVGADVTPAGDHDHDHGHGHDHEHDDHQGAAAKPRFLPAPSAAVCGPAAASAGPAIFWEPARAYQVGDFYLGVKANTPETDAVLAKVLAPIRDDTLEPPANLSLLLAGDGEEADGVRGLHMLLSGPEVLVRSRSEARVVRALLQWLSANLAVESELLVTDTVVAVADGGAVLLPVALRSKLSELQPKLSRAGIRIVETPIGLVDVATREVVVPEPAIAYDAAALAALPDPAPRGSELAPVEPGRYPLMAWCFGGDDGAFSTVKAAAHALSISIVQVEEAAMVEALVRLFESIPGSGVGIAADDEMVARIVEQVTG